MKKTVIFYVDDEPFQHIAMEQILPEDWELHCFENPIDAIAELKNLNPALIISDQRMPQMLGFKFLETARQICPDSIRIITTGYNDENSIIESIRSAKIFDYIVKPWDIDKLLQSLERAVSFYLSEKERKSLSFDLQEKNLELNSTMKDMEILILKYESAQKELKSWVHPFVLKASVDQLEFPIKKDLSLLVVDIVDSSKLHSINVDAQDVRTKILQTAWEIVLKHGGEIESQEGDKIYANFGLSDKNDNICNAAFAAAKEIRSSLQAINDHYGISVEAGIAIHFSKDCKVNLRQSAINTENGIIIRKKFDTSSIDVDLCHRLETLAHKLPGSNIILSEQIKNEIKTTSSFLELGSYILKGQVAPTSIHIIKSDKASEVHIKELSQYLDANFGLEKSA
jgi:CheY-like chemotaxis protein/class 3 adenylate cyclase